MNNVDAKEECGTRYPTYLIEGTYGVTGTLERFYTGSGAWGEFSIGNAAIPYVTLRTNPTGTGSGNPYIQIDGVKMNKIGVAHKLAANLMMETWDFIGTGSITVGNNS